MQRKPNLHLQVTPCGTSYPEHTAYWKQIFTQAWLTTAGKPSTEFPFKWGWEFISNWFVFEWKHGRVTACLKHDGHHVWVIFCHSQKPEFLFFSSECSFDFCYLLKLMIQSNAFFFNPRCVRSVLAALTGSQGIQRKRNSQTETAWQHTHKRYGDYLPSLEGRKHVIITSKSRTNPD